MGFRGLIGLILLCAAAPALAYALKGEDVETVIVNGRTLMEGKRLVTLDTAGIAAKAREIQIQVARSLAR